MITEANSDYGNMMDALFSAIKGQIPDAKLSAIHTKAKSEADKIRLDLKRKDRIIWFLRYLRSNIAQALVKQGAEPNSVARFIVPNSEKADIETLKHFLSLPIPEVGQFQFNNQSWDEVISKFKGFEDEWKKNAYLPIKPKPKDKPIIEFNNGWAW